MRITIVQGAFLPVPPVMGGAVEKVWYAMGIEFARRGHQVTHISRRCGDLPENEMIRGVEHRRVAGYDAPRSLMHLKFLDLLYSLRVVRALPVADILVTNTFFLPILVRHERHGRLYVHVARAPKGQMRLYSHAARLQTVSRPIADAISSEVPRLASKVITIPYPLQERVEMSDPPVREKRILFVGRIHPEKGVDLLIKAIALLGDAMGDWRLVIVGPHEERFGGGGAEYLMSLKALAGPLGDKVEWVGALFDEADLERAYRRAAIFVYPSLADFGETFGLAPLEAMSNGCVPVVSGLACFRDFIEDGINGLVFDHHAPQPDALLARMILELIERPDWMVGIASAAKGMAKQYELHRVAERYLSDFDLLESVT